MFELIKKRLSHTEAYPHLLSALQHCLLMPCEAPPPAASPALSEAPLFTTLSPFWLQTSRAGRCFSTGCCWTGWSSSWFCRPTKVQIQTWLRSRTLMLELLCKSKSQRSSDGHFIQSHNSTGEGGGAHQQNRATSTQNILMNH